MAKLYIEMQQILEHHESYLKKVSDEIIKLPIGSLYCSKQGSIKHFYYSHYINGHRQKKYLNPKKTEQAQLISDLKRKRFLLGCKKVLEGNVVALRACLLKYEEFDPTKISSRMAATYENIKDVARPQQGPAGSENQQDQQDQQDQKDPETRQDLDWQHSPYPRAEMHEDSLKHETIGGLKVRSKSEALIAFALELAHVPFHYEETLEIEGKKTAPDFTILHPVTGERVYWEHFGMMDDSAYATETFRKLILYGRNGIMPGKNLIYTMETVANPLSIQAIQRTIMHCFSC